MKPNIDSILTVGSLAFDTIETPSGKAESVLGGSVNYFSIAASFYAPVQIVGVVGEDFPQSHLEWLASRKIDVRGIRVEPGKTFHWVGSYDQNFNEAKTIHTALNVFETFDPTLDQTHRSAPYLFLANIDPTLQQRVLDQVASSRLVACDSMNFWIKGKLEELKKTLKRVDILSINEGEAFMLSGERNLVRAAEYVRKLGPSVVIIKRGEHGASLFTPSGTFIAPAFPVGQVVDPTGAGDSFAGAFMGYLAQSGAHRDLASSNPAQWDHLLRRAVLAGCVMASFTVEDFSVHRLMRLQSEELHARQNALMKMMAV
ncbi:MAG: sugar kinase [Bdellovibrionales bacterium RIFOXYC1_FULL_54_43]|nr:MAG: sugar kinase [Bdellovibrionales bacterium RIFOXYC1_FULL_54_43]OFZ83558.1 MAG: sugar kinase [Bdellovibrionales bacterium RIFOXYD1_FULL_55_31]